MLLDGRSRNQRVWILCGVLALVVKLALAATTLGTNDVITWHRFADSVDIEGPLWLYRADPMFNHPPFMTRVLSLLNWLANHTALGFPFWIRVPSILADFGSLYLIDRMLQTPARMLVMLALCPVSIFVSGFHGNSDPVMVFLVLLSIYFLECRGWLLAAALALGIAGCIKIVPVVLAPAFLFYVKTNRRRVLFAVAACATFVLCSLPYLVQDPAVIIRNVFGYKSLEGSWGFTHVARGLEVVRHHMGYVTTVAGVTRWMTALVITGLMLWIARRPVSLYGRCALSLFLFLWFSPGFGVQYLAWLVPFVLFFGEAWMINVYATSSVFLFLVYTYWSQEFPWRYADAFTMGIWPYWVIPFEFIAWLAIGFAALTYLRRLIWPASYDELVAANAKGDLRTVAET